MVTIFVFFYIFFRRHWQYEEEEEDNNNNNQHQEVSDDVEMMDENIAALVLTSLSCSPKSPQFQDLRGIHVQSYLY